MIVWMIHLMANTRLKTDIYIQKGTTMKISRMTANRLPLTILGAVFAVAIAGLFISVSAHALSLESIVKTFTADEGAKKPTVTGSAEAVETTQAAQTSPAQAAVTDTSAQSATLVDTTLSPNVTVSAAAIKSLASAQSQRVASEVTYPTQRIDAAKRDQLYSIAASIILIGGSLYAMTLLRVASYAPAPVQRRPLYIK